MNACSRWCRAPEALVAAAAAAAATAARATGTTAAAVTAGTVALGGSTKTLGTAIDTAAGEIRAALHDLAAGQNRRAVRHVIEAFWNGELVVDGEQQRQAGGLARVDRLSLASPPPRPPQTH